MNKKNVLFVLIITTAIEFFSSNYFFKISYEQKDYESHSEALGAFEFWNKSRAYPDEEILPDAFFKAFKELRKFRSDKPQRTIENPWVSIGPHNVAGRTIAFAFNPQNPNTVYAGSAGGGLWKSYTGGVGVNAWHYVSTGFPVLGVSAIEFAPSDSNIIYIGTGEVYNTEGAGGGSAYRRLRGTYGIGILKSTDGGYSWFKSLDWLYNSQKGVWVIKINPLNQNTVFANTTDGIYRSYDAGLNWQKVNNVVMGTDLIINPVDTNIILSSHGNFGSAGFGIYRSSDGGTRWSHITSGLPFSYQGKIQLDVYKMNPNIIYASIGHGFTYTTGASWLCKSTDSGLTWIILNQTDYSQHQGWYSHDVAIDQWNPDNLLVAGIAVWKSTDGGSTIIQKSDGGLNLGRPPIGGPEGDSNYTHCDVHSIVQHPTQQQIFYFCTDGGMFRTTDSGETFESINGGFQTTQFYNGTSSSQIDSLKVIGGLQDNTTVIYDGNPAWTKVIGQDGSWASIDPVNDNNIYASWQLLNILRSTDGGINFSPIAPPSSLRTCFIAPFRSFVGNDAIIYAGRDKIYKSTNSGNLWITTNNNAYLDGNPAIAIEISYQNSEKFYVATVPYGLTRGNIFKSTNGGSTYSNITGTLPDRFPSDIAINPYNDNIIYVTFFGFGGGHVFRSVDSGNNWNDVSDNLPDIPTTAVIIDPNNTNHIYVGTDIGVFVSIIGGGAWQEFNDGLPDVVQVMDLNYSNANDVIRVMTHGNGAYERKFLSQNSNTMFQFTVDVQNGWNMVSVPGINPNGMGVGTWWPHKTGTVWGFDGNQYVTKTAATPGEGYWMNNTITETYIYPAIQMVAHNPIPVTLGWNMIGGYENSPTVASLKAENPQITGTVWSFNGTKYIAATNIVPGYSYWVKVTTAGSIIIPDLLAKGNGEVVELFKEDWGKIVLTDATGLNFTLYAVKGEVDLDQYELPPLPPQGMFDIRYSSGRIAEDINSSVKTIDLTGVTYPLTVRVEGMDMRLMDESRKIVNVNLKSGEEAVISDATIQKLMVTGELIPDKYSLEQNYPNPFNPSTMIEFSLPENVSNVKLTIYSILGEKVAELVNTPLVAGKYSYQWNAINVATGMYIYELRTDKFVSVKKMLILK